MSMADLLEYIEEAEDDATDGVLTFVMEAIGQSDDAETKKRLADSIKDMVAPPYPNYVTAAKEEVSIALNKLMRDCALDGDVYREYFEQ